MKRSGGEERRGELCVEIKQLHATREWSLSPPHARLRHSLRRPAAATRPLLSSSDAQRQCVECAAMRRCGTMRMADERNFAHSQRALRRCGSRVACLEKHALVDGLPRTLLACHLDHRCDSCSNHCPRIGDAGSCTVVENGRIDRQSAEWRGGLHARCCVLPSALP